jgi:hypothetical protein
MPDPENTGRDLAGRWVKGARANPNGKPRGVQNRTTRLLDKMAAADAADVLRAVLDKAKAGDQAAAATVLARLWAPRKGRPVLLDLPPITQAADIVTAIGAVAAFVADGTLTPTEGMEVAAVIEASRRAIETVQLAADVAAIKHKLEMP